MSSAPNRYVRMVNQHGATLEKQPVTTWKDLRETVRKFTEEIESIDALNNLSVVVDQ